MKRILISPPFGNYIERDWATSVKGTYTWEKRSGVVLQALKTIRKVPGGWTNKMGLRNPGLENIDCSNSDHIWSVTSIGPDPDEWNHIIHKLPEGGKVEVNLSCPNVQKIFLMPKDAVMEMHILFNWVCCKLGPVNYWMLENLYENTGIRTFHLCNTIPSNGESGQRLKKLSLAMIDHAREEFGDMIQIVGGGGIYTPQDVDDYWAAGVDVFSLSTIFFTPWKVQAVVDRIHELTASEPPGSTFWDSP